MRIAILTLFALVCTIQADGSPYKLFSEEHIKFINSQATTWVAGRNFDENTSISQYKRLLGAKTPSKGSLRYKARVEIEDGTIPETFDSRERWPNCQSIKMIRDQSDCGSCWALAAVEAISDRICIHSDGKRQTLVSAIDLMSCCGAFCGWGCGGGYTSAAWDYWVLRGLSSGGEYGSGVGCKPYPFPQCNHHSNSTRYKKCPEDEYVTPGCSNRCSNSNFTYEKDLHRGKVSYAVENDVKQIQYEIMTNGPVEAGFLVYDDFGAYKSGVYQKTSTTEDNGGHAVKIIGWGNEKGTPYWLIANSWNEDWGDKGFFKIRRGTNECGIENEIVAGIPADDDN